MKLHDYQQNCLDVLDDFFCKSVETLPKDAFWKITQNRLGVYRHAPKMPEEMPYVCLRIPTGGGKTLMAAHAIGVAAKSYSQTESPVCLWLAPSSPIVEQTLKSLQDREHPCHLALMKAFPGRSINCISISDALRISRAEIDSGVTVIVATIQTLRLEKVEGRKVYEDNGNLMEHFDSIPEKLQDKLRRDQDGVVNQSLDNALQLRRPIIISDEAHNTSTALSYESLARFNPSCIVEFTATPQMEHSPKTKIYASNILVQASARQLKNASMIKFPINLEVVESWRENMRAAITKRRDLEQEGKSLSEYIRPIVLYQAESKDGEANVSVVVQALREEFNIPEEQVIVHTGETRGLHNIDLFSRNCEVRHIVTVRALAEGWDCSFAYILCTMANFQAARPVEQVLGRILRLPNASPKSIESFNQCYAFACKGRFYNVAHALKDTLIKKSGFQTMEADEFVRSKRGTDDTGTLFEHEKTSPQKKIISLSIPLLVVREKSTGRQKPLDFSHFLDAQWSIAKETPDETAFYLPEISVGSAVLDVNSRGRLVVENVEVGGVRGQLMLLDADKKWTKSSLVAWLDSSILHQDIPQMQTAPYILAMVTALCKKHDLPILARNRFHLRWVIGEEIKKLRQAQSKKGYQQMLDNMGVETGKLEVSPQCVLTFERGHYEALWTCKDTSFTKHLYPEVGELKDNGEEYECAHYIDRLSEVQVWVRNLERGAGSFWMQTSSGKFHPDFVCQLTDGRILVVEYKGEHLATAKEAQEKEDIGKVWDKLGGENCLFVMPKGPGDLSAIKKRIEDG